MIWIRWAFLAANVIYCLAWFRWTVHSSQLSAFGKTSMGSIAVWQLLGVVLVIWLRVSAWHLLCWFVAGYFLNMLVVRIMCRMGYETIK